jgi:hypothetical protein
MNDALKAQRKGDRPSHPNLVNAVLGQVPDQRFQMSGLATGQVKIYERLPRVTGVFGCPVLAWSTTLQTKKFDPELDLSSLSQFRRINNLRAFNALSSSIPATSTEVGTS